MRESSADIQRKHKKNRKNKRESLEKKKQFRFGRLVQPQSVGVLALTQSAHSQDLCWADTFSSDLREEPQPKVPKVHKMFTFACIVLLFLFKGKKHKQGHIRNIYIYIYIYIYIKLEDNCQKTMKGKVLQMNDAESNCYKIAATLFLSENGCKIPHINLIFQNEFHLKLIWKSKNAFRQKQEQVFYHILVTFI